MNLDELREALSGIDAQLVELVARRQALSEQVAAVKRATGRPTRDFAREREVILRGREAAARRRQLTMDEFIKENKELPLDLSGLKKG